MTFRAALDHLATEFPGVPLIAAGFSFGAWIGLRLGCSDRRVVRAHRARVCRLMIANFLSSICATASNRNY